MSEDKELTEEAIKEVLTSFVSRSDDELFGKTEEELESYWFFKWNDSISKERNTYQFHDLLKLYGSFCRRWEEHHHGSMCVVERVRDKYLMSKIKEFVGNVEA